MTVTKLSKKLVNEFGEEVTLEVIFTETSVSVSVTTEGTRDVVDDLLTPRERIALRELLAETPLGPKERITV